MKPQAKAVKKTAADIVDLIYKILSIIALIAGGIWAGFQFQIGGAQDWMTNLSVQADVLPYKEGQRIVVVHVRAKNPRLVTNDLQKGRDTFRLDAREVPDGLKTGSVVREGDGVLLASVDFLEQDVQLLPSAEFDNTCILILPAGITVELTAQVEVANGTKTKDMKDDHDFVTASTVLRVEVPSKGL
jgi:hypothetical protein